MWLISGPVYRRLGYGKPHRDQHEAGTGRTQGRRQRRRLRRKVHRLSFRRQNHQGNALWSCANFVKFSMSPNGLFGISTLNLISGGPYDTINFYAMLRSGPI